MEDSTRVLLVEPDREDQFIFAKMLVRGALDRYALRTVDRLGAVEPLFQEFRPDVVVTELNLPDSQGFRTFLDVHRIAGPTPCVVLTGTDDRGLGVRAIQHGAQDFLVKGEFSPASLDRALRHAMARAVIVQAAASVALHDELTGLPNRALLQDRLAAALCRADRRAERAAVLFVDLDRFKPVNDAHGHRVGDALLRAVGDRLHAALRASDTVARWGGDEFVCVLERVHDVATALRVAGALHRKLAAAPFEVATEDAPLRVPLGGSLGVAVYPDHGRDPEALLQRADEAMYAAKALGGGCVLYGSDAMRALAPHHVGELLRAGAPAQVAPLLRALSERERS